MVGGVGEWVAGVRTEGLGMSMAAQMTMFMGTNADKRNGAKIFSPVSPCTMASLTGGTARQHTNGGERVLLGEPWAERERENEEGGEDSGESTLFGSPQVFLRKVAPARPIVLDHGEGPAQLIVTHEQRPAVVRHRRTRSFAHGEHPPHTARTAHAARVRGFQEEPEQERGGRGCTGDP